VPATGASPFALPRTGASPPQGTAPGEPYDPEMAELDADLAKWDAGHIHRALTSPEALVDAFNMPRTPDTLAAAVRVVSSLKAEADARVAVCHPATVDVIEARLQGVASGRGIRARMARHMLSAFARVPPRARQVTHALLVRASTQQLVDALDTEFRVMARTLTGVGAPTPAGWRLHDATAPALAPSELAALFAPLSGTDGLAELALPRRRRIEREVGKRVEAETEAWASQAEAAYEDGTAFGACSVEAAWGQRATPPARGGRAPLPPPVRCALVPLLSPRRASSPSPTHPPPPPQAPWATSCAGATFG